MIQTTRSSSTLNPGDRVEHRKGGTYAVIGVGNIQASNWRDHTDKTATFSVDMEPVVVYQSERDGKIWVRPLAEFMDGSVPPRRRIVSPGRGTARRRPAPRFSIPARHDKDDDLVVSEALEEAAGRIAALSPPAPEGEAAQGVEDAWLDFEPDLLDDPKAGKEPSIRSLAYAHYRAHMNAERAQHYTDQYVDDPCALALALHAVTGDFNEAVALIRAARREASR